MGTCEVSRVFGCVKPARLSGKVRGRVGARAPNLFVMTRESADLPLEASGGNLTNCEGECLVEIGKRLGADYVISGREKEGNPIERSVDLEAGGIGRLHPGDDSLAKPRPRQASGSEKKKRLPRPGSLSTQMRPPCASTMPRAIDSPRPTPCAVGPWGPWK